MSRQRVQTALVLLLLGYSIAALALTRSTPQGGQRSNAQSPTASTQGGNQNSAVKKSVVDYSGDLYNSRDDPDSVIRLSGDSVAFHHNGAFIECDSAIRLGDYSMEGFGNVVIYKDSTYIYGDRVSYNGYNDIATVYSPIVKLMRDDAALYAYNQVDFNTKTSIGYFNDGGVIIQRDIVMESTRGIYNGDSSEIRFINNVALRNDNYKIRTDSVSYSINSETITFLAPTYIWDKDRDFLTATSGKYISSRQTYYFTHDAYAMTPSQEFWADTMSYHSLEKEAIMYNNIQILDTAQRTIAFGDYGYYNDSLKRGMLTRTPSIISFQSPKEDSISTAIDSTTSVTDSVLMDGSASDSTTTIARGQIPTDSLRSSENTPQVAIKSDPEATLDSTQLNSQEFMPVNTTGDQGNSIPSTDDPLANHPIAIEPAKPAPDSTYMRADSIFFTSFAKGLSKTLGELPPPQETTLKSDQMADTLSTASDSTTQSNSIPSDTTTLNSDSLATSPESTYDQNLAHDSTAVTQVPTLAADSTGLTTSTKVLPQTPNKAVETTTNSLAITAPLTNTLSTDSLATVMRTSSDSLPSGQPTEMDSLTNSQSATADTLFRRTDPKVDSLERVLRAYYNVKVYRRDMQSVCDSLIGFSVDSTMSMLGSPLLWNVNNQISAERIDLYSKNEELDYADLIGTPFITQQVTSTIKWDTIRYNQATGRALKVWFRNSEVDRAQFTGNVRNYYYMENNKGSVKQFAIIDCAELMMYFKGQDPRRLTWIGSPVWVFYPIRQIPTDQSQLLPDFTWEPDRRPKSREEITTRAVRPSERIEREKLAQPVFPIHERMMQYRQTLTNDGIWRDRNEPIRSTINTFLGNGGRQGL